MKKHFLILSALLVFACGCQSHGPVTTSTDRTPAPQNAPPAVAQEEPKPIAVQQIKTDTATYTIETIPNTKLTPTSREGDERNHIYSSNIIAVHVHPNNSVTVTSTNAPAIPAPANNPPPQTK